MSQDFVAVLDLGTTKAVALAASADGDKIKVRAVATTPCKAMRKGALVDPAEAARSIEVVIRRLEQDLGAPVTTLVAGIAGSHVQGLNAQGLKMIVPRSRTITHQDVLEVINHSRAVMLPSEREQIQVLPREFRVDAQRNVMKPVGMSGGKLEVRTYLVTGEKDAIQKLERAIETTEKKVDQMVLASLASGVAVLAQDELEAGAAVVDIGGGSTDIAVFQDGSLAYTASIPVGADHVTSDLSKLLKTSHEEAERLKLEYGSAMASTIAESESVEVLQLEQTHTRPMQRRVLCEIIDSRMREIANMVREHLEKEGYDATLSGGITLTGGGAQLQQVEKLFSDTLPQMKVRHAEPELGGKFPRQPGMATAVGLARFAIQCQDEIMPATGTPVWRDRVRSLFSMISGR